MDKKLLAKYFVTLSILVIFVYLFSTKENPITGVDTQSPMINLIIHKPDLKNTNTWKEYINEKYKFSIQYPSNWYIYENNDAAYPSIAFLPNPIIDNSTTVYRLNMTQVSIYPHGYGSEGFGTESAESKLPRISSSTKQWDFILHENKRSFITQALYTNTHPTNWMEGSFILGRLLVNNLESKCTTRLRQNECDIFEGDKYITTGTIANESDRAIIERVLASFKFID